MSAPLAGLLFFVGVVALFAGIFIADTRCGGRIVKQIIEEYTGEDEWEEEV